MRFPSNNMDHNLRGFLFGALMLTCVEVFWGISHAQTVPYQPAEVDKPSHGNEQVSDPSPVNPSGSGQASDALKSVIEQTPQNDAPPIGSVPNPQDEEIDEEAEELSPEPQDIIRPQGPIKTP